jgi:hypothetical protein
MAKKKEEAKPLFRVLIKGSNRPAYLGEGIEEEEAKRLSNGLAVETYIQPLDQPEEES